MTKKYNGMLEMAAAELAQRHKDLGLGEDSWLSIAKDAIGVLRINELRSAAAEASQLLEETENTFGIMLVEAAPTRSVDYDEFGDATPPLLRKLTATKNKITDELIRKSFVSDYKTDSAGNKLRLRLEE